MDEFGKDHDIEILKKVDNESRRLEQLCKGEEALKRIGGDEPTQKQECSGIKRILSNTEPEENDEIDEFIKTTNLKLRNLKDKALESEKINQNVTKEKPTEKMIGKIANLTIFIHSPVYCIL